MVILMTISPCRDGFGKGLKLEHASGDPDPAMTRIHEYRPCRSEAGPGCLGPVFAAICLLFTRIWLVLMLNGRRAPVCTVQTGP